MDKRFDFDFKPFPDERFADDATVECVGVPVKDHRGNLIGHITKYKIENGDLVCTVEQDA